MTHELDHERDHEKTDARRDDAALATPGRRSTSASLDGPAQPIPSGLLMRKGGGAVSDDAEAAVARASGGGGEQLPADLRQRFESSLGTDLGDVRLHNGSDSHQAAGAISAKAYASGNDIHFGAGQFDPHSSQGQELIAHEVAHTVQQRGGQAPARQHKLAVSHAHDWLEVDADRAATAMMTGAPATVEGGSSAVARAVLHRRPLDDEGKKIWDEHDGDSLVLALKSEVSAWAPFAKAPASFEGMPGKGVPSLVGKIGALFAVDPKHGAFLSHFLDEIGRESVLAMRQMASINNACRGLADLGLTAFVDPGHKWTMTVVSSGVVGKFLPVSSVKVMYKNNVAMAYSHELTGAMVGFSVGVGKEAGKPAKGGASVAPAKISINGSAEATNVAFWGYDNLAGLVTVAGGPSGEAKVGPAGGSFNTGSMINLVGSGVPTSPLTFKNFKGSASIDVQTDPKKVVKDAQKKPSFGITLASVAGGVLAGGQTEVFVAEPEPKKIERVWKQTLIIDGFDTGKDDLEASQIAGPLAKLKTEVDQIKKLVEADKPILESSFQITQDFKLQFVINGYASRAWTAAKSDAERKRLNEELSLRRAQTVATAAHAMFGSDHSYETFGKGGSAVIVTDKPQVDVVPEDGHEKELDKQADANAKRNKQDDPSKSEAEHRKDQEKVVGKQSNAREARSAEVIVSFTGYGVDWELDKSPVGKDPNQGKGGGRGDGGGEGAGPTGRGGGGAGGAPAD